MDNYSNLVDQLNPSIKTDLLSPIHTLSDNSPLKHHLDDFLPYQAAQFRIKSASLNLEKNQKIDAKQVYILKFPQSVRELDLTDESLEFSRDYSIDQNISHEIDDIVYSLLTAISTSLSIKSGANETQLYNLPENYTNFTVKDKIKLAREISIQLATETQNTSPNSSLRKSKEDSVKKNTRLNNLPNLF